MNRPAVGAVGGPPGGPQPDQLFDQVRVPEPAVGQGAGGVGVVQEDPAHPLHQLTEQRGRFGRVGVGRHVQPGRRPRRLRRAIGGGGFGELGDQLGQLLNPGRQAAQRLDRPPQSFDLTGQAGDRRGARARLRGAGHVGATSGSESSAAHRWQNRNRRQPTA